MFKQLRKAVSIIILTAFIGTSVRPPAFAQVSPMPFMPKPGTMVELSPEFAPAYLKGIVIHPENALKFDFIIYKGDKELSDAQKREEYTKLSKYFLASLAIPDEDQWVNLSPYEKDKIIQNDFGKTEMGRDLLAQDYMLKQITASLIYPEDSLGKKFWDKVYTEAQKQYGTTQIPVNTFNKVWILPDDALIYEKDNTAYIIKNHLRVMLEEDYLSLKKHAGIQSAPMDNKTHTIASKIVRQIILPELEREVNEDENFATVRQVYSSMLLATWYKRALKESLLGKIYANKNRIKGVDQDPKTNEMIYQRYLRAYKKGVFNFIKEDVDKYTNEVIPRKYFSGGGVSYAMAANELGLQLKDIVKETHEVTTHQAAAMLTLAKNKLVLVEEAEEELGVEQQFAHAAMAARKFEERGPSVSTKNKPTFIELQGRFAELESRSTEGEDLRQVNNGFYALSTELRNLRSDSNGSDVKKARELLSRVEMLIEENRVKIQEERYRQPLAQNNPVSPEAHAAMMTPKILLMSAGLLLGFHQSSALSAETNAPSRIVSSQPFLTEKTVDIELAGQRFTIPRDNWFNYPQIDYGPYLPKFTQMRADLRQKGILKPMPQGYAAGHVVDTDGQTLRTVLTGYGIDVNDKAAVDAQLTLNPGLELNKPLKKGDTLLIGGFLNTSFDMFADASITDLYHSMDLTSKEKTEFLNALARNYHTYFLDSKLNKDDLSPKIYMNVGLSLANKIQAAVTKYHLRKSKLDYPVKENLTVNDIVKRFDLKGSLLEEFYKANNLTTNDLGNALSPSETIAVPSFDSISFTVKKGAVVSDLLSAIYTSDELPLVMHQLGWRNPGLDLTKPLSTNRELSAYLPIMQANKLHSGVIISQEGSRAMTTFEVLPEKPEGDWGIIGYKNATRFGKTRPDGFRMSLLAGEGKSDGHYFLSLSMPVSTSKGFPYTIRLIDLGKNGPLAQAIHENLEADENLSEIISKAKANIGTDYQRRLLMNRILNKIMNSPPVLRQEAIEQTKVLDQNELVREVIGNNGASIYGVPQEGYQASLYRGKNGQYLISFRMPVTEDKTETKARFIETSNNKIIAEDIYGQLIKDQDFWNDKILNKTFRSAPEIERLITIIKEKIVNEYILKAKTAAMLTVSKNNKEKTDLQLEKEAQRLGINTSDFLKQSSGISYREFLQIEIAKANARHVIPAKVVTAKFAPTTKFIPGIRRVVKLNNLEPKSLKPSAIPITHIYGATRKNAAMVYGGIDFNSANLNLSIKRDGKGVPLPFSQQDISSLNNLQGLEPVILDIRPAADLPIFSQLPNGPIPAGT